MLDSIFIENIVLIQEAEIEFENKLNILTGETGAGKSIIINSLKFILGEKTSKTLLRNENEKAKVQAVFSNVNEEVKKYLEEIGIDDCDEIILERELSQTGKTVSRINKEKVTNSILKTVTQMLVDLSSQNESIKIMDDKTHINILDCFAKKEVDEIKNKFSNLYNKYDELLKKYNLYIQSDISLKEKEYLQELLDEIKNLDLKENELNDLEEKKEIIDNSQEIIASLSRVNEIFSNEEFNAISLISEASSTLSNISSYSKKIEELIPRLDNLEIELEDILNTVQKELETINFDENEAYEITERLDKLKKTERKFKMTIAQILKYKEEIKEKIDMSDNRKILIEKTELEINKVLDEIYLVLIELRDKRKKEAEHLENLVIKELNDLYMKDAKFKVVFNDFPIRKDLKNVLTKNGVDKVVFMMKINKGQEFTELSKTISGGEMSRLTLALKIVLQDIDNIQTVIFDEIDTGISGLAALTVGKKLEKLSKKKQVILVTHLAQIAALSDTHFKIEKFEKDNKTITNVKKLSNVEKIEEISRLISGNLTDTVRESAKELIASKE